MKILKNLKISMVSLAISSTLLLACQKDLTTPIDEQEENEDSTNVDKGNPTVVEKANFYVSLKGNDSNTGAIDKPFKTIEKAFSVAGNTALIYIRGGVYPLKDLNLQYAIKFSGKNGLDSVNKIKIWAYPGERVIIDCKGMNYKNDGLFGIYIASNNIHIKGFDVINLPQFKNSSGQGYYNVGILIKANNVLLENCSAHDCQGTGINLGGSCSGTFVLNCDAYNNYDPYTYSSDGTPYPGGNADGFHITVNGLNSKQYLKGCRSWNNSDDGYDFFNTDGYVCIDSCWAFHNGYLPDSNTQSGGDGSGIKLGATTSSYAILKKTIKNCVSAYNKAEGFTQNNGRVVMHLYNNTAYKNGGIQFDFGNKFAGQEKIEIKNNIAFGASINHTPYAIHDHNSWDLSVKVDDSDFQSVDISLLNAQRQNNGGLPNNNIFKLATSSDLKSAAINLGCGINIGAF
jgi:hypothetical protein